VKILRPYPLEKVFYCLGQGGKNTDLQKVCEKPPSLLSRNIFVLFFVQEKALKNVFRMTSLGINVRPLFILGLGLHHCISFVRPFDGEELWGIPWPIHTTGVPAESHAIPSQKKRLRKGEVTERCQQPARGENTNDDDEMITFIS